MSSNAANEPVPVSELPLLPVKTRAYRRHNKYFRNRNGKTCDEPRFDHYDERPRLQDRRTRLELVRPELDDYTVVSPDEPIEEPLDFGDIAPAFVHHFGHPAEDEQDENSVIINLMQGEDDGFVPEFQYGLPIGFRTESPDRHYGGAWSRRATVHGLSRYNERLEAPADELLAS